MPELQTVNQVVQIAKEVPAGTRATTGFQQLKSMSLDPASDGAAQFFRPTGILYETVQALGKEWTTIKVTGMPTYDEVVYPLCSLLKNVSPTTGTPATSRLWTIDPAYQGGDLITTYTVEQGVAGFVHFATYGLFTEWGFTLDRNAFNGPGTMMARRLDVTSSNSFGTQAGTQIGLVPIIPTQFSIYLETTGASLGTTIGATTGATKLTRAFVSNFKIANRFGPVWPVDAAQTSFAAHVELPPAATFDLTLAADAQGLGLYTELRGGGSRFVRIVATGAVIGIGPDTYAFQIDAAIKMDVPKAWPDHEGVFAITWPCKIVYDATWGHVMLIKVNNTLTAL